MAIYRVIVTPTMHIFEPADYEEGNHLLRLFKDRQFHFLRVNFCSNAMDTIFFSERTRPLIEYYYRIIADGAKSGIRLGKLHLNFLGYSNA